MVEEVPLSYRIVFVGATRFGLRCLETVLGMPGCEVVGIITLPETFSISYRPAGVRNVLHADFAPLAAQHAIPVYVMTGKMTDAETLERTSGWAPNLILVAGWYHMVPRALREIAPAAGLHASLLPDYSGGAPLVWAMINGESRTGITFFLMDDGVDSGPIIAQAEERILEEDTIATLYARIEERGLELLREHLPKLARGDVTLRSQDHSRRRVFPQRSPEDGRIDWRWPARRVYDFARAQTRPYPGAFTFINGERLIVWRAAVAPSDGPAKSAICPGLVHRGSLPLVECGDGNCITLLEVQRGTETAEGTEIGAGLARWAGNDERVLLGD